MSSIPQRQRFDSRRGTCFASDRVAPVEFPEKGGWSVFAIAPIELGERIAVFGGRVVMASELAEVPRRHRHLLLQVEEDAYLLSEKESTADWFNHSCEPNAGMCGPITLVALRDVDAGEEICFDYAMSDGSDYDQFDCACGAPTCRGRVTGSDWQIRELWDRYDGHFSPYLARRIEQLRARGDHSGS